MTRPLTVQQVAERWACSKQAVYALIHAGQLPHFRAGGKLLRVRLEDVERWESAGGKPETLRPAADVVPLRGR